MYISCVIKKINICHFYKLDRKNFLSTLKNSLIYFKEKLYPIIITKKIAFTFTMAENQAMLELEVEMKVFYQSPIKTGGETYQLSPSFVFSPRRLNYNFVEKKVNQFIFIFFFFFS